MADVKLALVTPEVEPLHLFGGEASAAVRALLEARGIVVHTRAYPAEAREGELLLVGGDILPADRVVALPRLQGQRIGGIPQTFEGFIPVDPHGRVIGLADVYAAGDITTFTVKQGGIAAQQAEAAAESIAAASGVAIEPRPFRPVLRGLLLTGDGPQYLHGELKGGARHGRAPSRSGGRRRRSSAGTSRRSSHRLTGTGVDARARAGIGVPVEVELEATGRRAAQRPPRLGGRRGSAARSGGRARRGCDDG